MTQLSQITHKFRLTRGEWLRCLGFGLALLVAATLSHWIITRSGVSASLPVSTEIQIMWNYMAGAFAALVGLFLAQHWFGTARLLGGARAILGLAIASVITVGIGLTLIAPLYFGALGELLVHALLADWGIAPAVWFGTLWMCHVWSKPLHDERSSIFNAVLSEPVPLRQFSVLSRLRLPDTHAHQRARWIGN